MQSVAPDLARPERALRRYGFPFKPAPHAKAATECRGALLAKPYSDRHEAGKQALLIEKCYL
jgi:hypothetical protein